MKMSEEIKEENGLENVANANEEIEFDAQFRRKVIAFTVGAVVLLALLLILMCYQLIKIGVENSRKAELTAAIAEVDAALENGETTIEIMQKKWWIVQRARELGYEYPGDF